MVKKHRKHKSTKKRRTVQEIEEEQSRTLYIRLPKTIKDMDEVKSLFVGDIKVKLPRQSTRHCHVIFSSIEDKRKNLEEVKQKIINGKPIIAKNPRPIDFNKPKRQKKIKIPDPAEEPNVSKYLLISNLPLGTKASEVKEAFPGTITVVLLKRIVRGKRQARIKMSSSRVSLQYVKNRSQWPKFKGKRCNITFSKSKNKPNKKKTKTLMVYNGESEVKNDEKSLKKNKKIPEDKENKELESNGEEQSDENEIESGD